LRSAIIRTGCPRTALGALGTLAGRSTGMLDQLASQNVRLENTHDELEGLLRNARPNCAIRGALPQPDRDLRELY